MPPIPPISISNPQTMGPSRTGGDSVINFGGDQQGLWILGGAAIIGLSIILARGL